MELIDKNATVTKEFTETLNRLVIIIRKALEERKPELNGEKFLTNTDISKLLHISQRTLQEYRDNGIISYIKISGKILYKESDILKLLEDNYVSFQ